MWLPMPLSRYFTTIVLTVLALFAIQSWADGNAGDVLNFASEQPQRDPIYQPDFPSISRSIIGRQDNTVQEDLSNNVPASTNTIQPGGSQLYRFPSSALHGPRSNATPIIPSLVRKDEEEEHFELRKRQNNDVIYYLTLSVCSQPLSSTSTNPPGQLSLIISYNNPNADGTAINALTPNVVDGFGSFSDPTSGDIYVRVNAPPASGYTGSWTFELVVSIDDFYGNYIDDSNLYLIDTDNGAAMFASGNLAAFSNGSIDTNAVELWNNLGPRYNLVVANQADARFNGLMHSYCALKNTTQAGGSVANQTAVQVETGLTTVGGPAIQQQFYLSGLQSATAYSAAMGIATNYSSAGSGQPGGGGIIYQQVDFETKIENNCRIIYNLTFCPQVNWAVPFNPLLFNGPNLTAWYNSNITAQFQFFEYALQTVPCNATPDSQYSLAVTCDDCTRAYTSWLCAVMAPRCNDFSNPAPYLHVRNVAQSFPNGTNGTGDAFNQTYMNALAFNSSRNPNIDAVIMPGPYKETLPCGELCYSLVRSCPASMGFACPYNPHGFNDSYGYPLMDGLTPQCNMPGAFFGVSSAASIRVSLFMVLLFSVFSVFSFGFG